MRNKYKNCMYCGKKVDEDLLYKGNICEDCIPEDKIPAIPPDDYKGTIADWNIALMERGLMKPDFSEFYGDILIDENMWDEILEECENEK